MAATFACPHCGATYPIKPVLIGRTVRCTSCKQAFRLREDGVAEVVALSQPAPTTAAEPGTGAPPTHVEPTAASHVQPVAKPRSDGSSRISNSGRSQPSSGGTSRLTSRQESLRQAMSATLSEAAAKALVKQREPAHPAGSSGDRPIRRSEGGTPTIQPAILSGDGLNEARRRRSWWLIVLGLLALLVGIIILSSGSDPRREALRAFAAAEPSTITNPMARLEASRQRAWLPDPTMPIILDLGDADLGTPRTHSLRALSAGLDATIRGKARLPEQRLWVSKDQVDNARRLLQGVNPGQALQLAGIEQVGDDDIADRLANAGLPREAATIITNFLLHPEAEPIVERWLQGDTPKSLELQPFSATSGRQLLPVPGTAPRSRSAPYRGLLLRWPGWMGLASDDPGGWRVFELVTTER